MDLAQGEGVSGRNLPCSGDPTTLRRVVAAASCCQRALRLPAARPPAFTHLLPVPDALLKRAVPLLLPQSWIEEMSGFLKQQDANHLVTVRRALQY